MADSEEDTVTYYSRNGTHLIIYNWAAGGKYPVHGAYWGGTDAGWIQMAWQENGMIDDARHCPLDIDFEKVEILA